MTAHSANKWTVICQHTPTDSLVKMLASNFELEAIYAAQAELAQRANPSPCPNLDRWRKELADGRRSIYTFDEVWKAACDEARQMEFVAGSRIQSHHSLGDQ